MSNVSEDKRAIIDAVRGHRDDIATERIILWIDSNKPGNALSQLADRISPHLAALEAARGMAEQWQQVGQAQRNLADSERDIGLRASLVACSNAWLSAADDLKKAMEKAK